MSISTLHKGDYDDDDDDDDDDDNNNNNNNNNKIWHVIMKVNVKVKGKVKVSP